MNALLLQHSATDLEVNYLSQHMLSKSTVVIRICIPGHVFSFPGIRNVQMSFPGFLDARE